MSASSETTDSKDRSGTIPLFFAPAGLFSAWALFLLRNIQKKLKISLMKKILLSSLVLVISAFLVSLVWYIQKPAEEKDVIIKENKPLKAAEKEKAPEIPKAEKYDVPILMYHYIRDAKDEDQLGKNLSVHPDNFEAHIKWMKENNYEAVKMEDLADPERKTISKALFNKKKPIVLTFDDGYLDAYTSAFPILKKYNFIGTFYIIRNSVGKAEYMNQNQINEMGEAGMEIGSHTLSHPNLSSLSEESQRIQIKESKEKAQTFCYPAGRYNDTTVSLVKEAEYKTAVTTKFGIANQDSNPLELRRVRVEDGNAQSLQYKIEAAYEQTPK